MLQSNISINNYFVQAFETALPAGNNKLPASNRGFVFTANLKDGKMEQKTILTRKALRSSNEQYVTASAFYRGYAML